MVYFWFSSGNAYSNGTILYIQVHKAVHKQSELWQINAFARGNKDLILPLAIAYPVR